MAWLLSGCDPDVTDMRNERLIGFAKLTSSNGAGSGSFKTLEGCNNPPPPMSVSFSRWTVPMERSVYRHILFEALKTSGNISIIRVATGKKLRGSVSL